MPTLGFHISDDSPLASKIQKKADRFHDGKISQYVRSVVEKDLGYAIDASDDEGPFIRLVREVRPDLLSAAEEAIATAKTDDHKFNETKFLGKIVGAAVDYLRVNAIGASRAEMITIEEGTADLFAYGGLQSQEEFNHRGRLLLRELADQNATIREILADGRFMSWAPPEKKDPPLFEVRIGAGQNPHAVQPNPVVTQGVSTNQPQTEVGTPAEEKKRQSKRS